jgi:hypothetical protein
MNRHCLARSIIAGAMGALLLLGGCAMEGSPASSSQPFAKKDRDEAVARQGQADSFPTAKQVGL